MSNTGTGTRPDVTLKVSQLQNLCKRDPEGYREDYDAQVRRLRSECGILALSPSATPSPRLVELIQFAAAVSSSTYKGKESDSIADLLIALLLGQSAKDVILSNSMSSPSGNNNNKLASAEPINMVISTSALSLHRDVRKACVSALILMRNKGAVPPLRLLELFFRIMSSIPDKGLREHLYRHIVNDVRNINKKGKRDEAVNRSVQRFLHRVVGATITGKNSKSSESTRDIADNGESASVIAAKRSVDMITELYRRQVWTDERTIAIMASAVQSSNSSVISKAIRFFLNIEEKMADDKEKKDNDEWEGASEIDFHLHSRKTKKRTRKVGKGVLNKLKEQHKRESDENNQSMNLGIEAARKLYPAIEMLRDPQGVAEAVFKKIRASGSNTYKFEAKVLMINFVSRLVGNHELLVLPFYPFLQRYMGGHQRDVTSILSYAVQACHEYVPPNEIYGLLKTISHNFVTERCTGEQMAVGINSCRAICARVPSVLSVEDKNADDNVASTTMDIEAFARDLAAYSKHRDRSVAIAGKSWTNFIRSVYPTLLQGKDRGSVGAALHKAGEKPLRYGEHKVASGVAGADLLLEYESKKALYLKNIEERRARGEDIESDYDSDDSIMEEKMNDNDEEEWINVEQDDIETEANDEETEEMVEDEESDENGEKGEAPLLISMKEVDGNLVPVAADEEKTDDDAIDLSKMTAQERKKMTQEASSTRIFSAADFDKMRRLVDREERVKRDPRAAAKLKRRRAKGQDFVELSDDDSDMEEEEGIRVKGVVNPADIMANSKKKRMTKIEKLEKIVAGRTKFEFKERDGGSTNTEKKRKKNFVMTKYSQNNREKQGSKETARQATMRSSQKKHDKKKRRRKT